jgi:endonuclease/exonuclease/phosphatase family metal-dependent hydrolase
VSRAPAPPARLRVVTWNIRAAIGPGEPFPPAWWRHVRRDRLERIGALLAELDPDVATLQEVSILTPHGELLDQPAELARMTGRHVRYAAVHAFPLVEPETGRAIGTASWGNAILSSEPLVDGFALALPRAGDDDPVEVHGAIDPRTGDVHPLIGVPYADTEPGHREPRCMVGGTLGGVTIATAHLTYIGRAQRRAQAEALAALATERPGPLIVTGDFNAPLDAPELAPLTGAGLGDALLEAGVAAGDDSRITSGGAAIDHILVRGLAVEACRVERGTGDASDHWPVVADLRLE